MKAKEYAARLVSAVDFGDAVIDVLNDLTRATMDVAKSRSQTSGAMACIRETFTKWKSIVAQVKAQYPDCGLDDSLFPKYISAASPALYTLAMENRVFLGYTPDAGDLAVAQQGRMELENIALRERVAALEKAAKNMGIRI